MAIVSTGMFIVNCGKLTMAGWSDVLRYRKNPLDISITEKILQSNGKPLQL